MTGANREDAAVENSAQPGGKPIAVVTGTSGGLGRVIAATLRDRGYAVVGLDIRPDADGTVDRFFPCDLGCLADLPALLERIEVEAGPIAVLVNNAAYLTDAPLAELTPDEIVATLTINVGAVLVLTRSVADAMARRGGGAIVNMASVAGLRGSSQVAYGASKAGVINLTKTLSKHYAAAGVRINAVAPGLVETGMGERLSDAVRSGLLAATPLGRGARPQEIAEVVAFLAGDAASYITGETISVSGGI